MAELLYYQIIIQYNLLENIKKEHAFFLNQTKKAASFIAQKLNVPFPCCYYVLHSFPQNYPLHLDGQKRVYHA